MKIDYDIALRIGDGNSEIGMGYASRGWERMLFDPERTDARKLDPSIAECIQLDCVKEIVFGNPLGLFSKPMLLDQYGESLKLAYQLSPIHPEWENRQAVCNRLDIIEMGYATRQLTKPFSFYVGSISQLKPFAGEAQYRWLNRLKAILTPYIQCHPRCIYFDAMMGPRPSWPDEWQKNTGLMADGIAWLRSEGIEVGIEPFNYAAYEPLRLARKIILPNTLDDMVARHWKPRQVDEGQTIQIPGDCGEPVMQYLQLMRYSWSDEQKLRYMNERQAMYPSYLPLINNNTLPRGLFA